MLPPKLAHLPAPAPAAWALHLKVEAQIADAIGSADGWLPFAQYMALALYAPGLGYYSAGSAKLGGAGDFITAPELSPLYARCLARQVSELIEAGLPDVIEIGAGSGALAAGMLNALDAAGRPPRRYRILEVSAELRSRQQALIRERAPALADRVEWLERLPSTLDAVVLANEVLDAMPVHVVRAHENRIEELGVVASAVGGFERAWKPAAGELARTAGALDLPAGYETEINLAAGAWVRSFGAIPGDCAMLLIDYGFPAREYYHPQRSQGTLMCHYRHHAHDDPLVLAGLQDITAHIDFTALATAGVDAGFEVLGFATQAQFLINTGIAGMLGEVPASDARAYAPLAAAVQKLTSPAEMGELFKVLALVRGPAQPLLGFARGDRTHTL